MAQANRVHRIRRAVGSVVVAVLLGGLLPLTVPVAANACGSPADICADNRGSEAVGGSGQTPSAGSSCEIPLPGSVVLDSRGKWRVCGSYYFSGGGSLPVAGLIYGTPSTDAVANTSPVFLKTSTTLISHYGDAINDCSTATRSYQDPMTGQWVRYKSLGFNWVDDRLWMGLAGGGLYGVVQYTYRANVNYLYIYGRDFSYNCIWPATPSTIYKTCPTMVTGKMVGPYSNAVTDAYLRTLNVAWGDSANQKLRTWIVPQYSAIGSAFLSYGSRLSPDPGASLDLVQNCPDMQYAVSVSAANGCWMGVASDNPTTPKNGTDCSFVPGNYNKKAWGKQIVCWYAHYPWAMGGYDAFMSCAPPGINPQAAYAGQAHWKCSPDYLGTNGQNTTYNFANCDGNVPPPVACTWSSSSTGIIDPYGVSQTSGSQVAADGKQWKVGFPVPVCPATAQNRWTQWIVASGSQPFRAGALANASNQPVFGNYDPNNTTTSVLAQVGVRSGVQDWGHPNLYLRFNQATTTTTSKSLKVGGDTSNPVTVRGTSAVPAPVPFGVYALYHYTQPVRTCTVVGGCVIIQVPYVLKTPAVWFYTVSGRVSGTSN